MEIVVNIGVLITIIGFLLFLMRRIDNLRVEIKADMEKMETGLKADMLRMEAKMDKMETGLKADMLRMETGIRADMKDMEASMEKMETGIRSDMEKMETGLKEDMTKMEARIIADMNLKHGEVREDMRDIRVGLVAVRERQARFEGILEGMGHTAEPEPEPVVSAD